MNLDLFRLQVFVTVVDRNGYSAAARRLNLAQPSVSRHVSELERACGAELLQYRDRGIHLTAAGREVYRAALVMLTEQHRLQDSLGDLRNGRHGRIRLGVSMAFEQKYFFEDVIAPFARRHEGTQLSVRFGHSPREAQAVVDGQLDLAYVTRWHLPTEAEFEFLHDLRLTFVASRDHPLAGRQAITVCDIAEAGLITAPFIGVEASFYREVLREFGLTGDHSVIEVDGLQTRFLATAAGLGVMATFIPDHAREAVRADLALLDVEGRPTTVQAGLVWRSDQPGSSTTDELAAWLRKLSAHRAPPAGPSGGTAGAAPDAPGHHGSGTTSVR